MKSSHDPADVHQQFVCLNCNGEQEKNTLPFKQPFLELRGIKGPLIIDVGGDLSPFLNEEGVNHLTGETPPNGPVDKGLADDRLKAFATPLLKKMAQALRAHGIVITSVHAYIGSAGPRYVYRQGVLFERRDEFEKPPESLAISAWMD